ncbi:unnamed protein product [Prunus brigantina]
MASDSPLQSKSPYTSNIFFLFILFLSTNLLTLFFSSYFSIYSLKSLSTVATTADLAKPTTGLNLLESPTEDKSDLPPEFLAFASGQLLPFGYNINFDSNTIYPAVGQACTLFPDLLSRFMSYKVNGSCPDDEFLAQRLLLKGCEPLPRRRCRPASNANYVEPYPLPKRFDDCIDCFDLEGNEKTRWGKGKGGGLDFGVDEVLGFKKPGTIRIGLDIGGGVATFAVRMRERNVTIVTTSMNLNGPFNSFIASRGVVPLYISISQRLPFFDNTLDIVHSMHVLSNWIPTTLLHFAVFDIYRILRPGGLFWLDHFFCVGEQLEEVYGPLIESVGFKKLKWVVGRKLDRGPERRRCTFRLCWRSH